MKKKGEGEGIIKRKKNPPLRSRWLPDQIAIKRCPGIEYRDLLLPLWLLLVAFALFFFYSKIFHSFRGGFVAVIDVRPNE